MRYVTKEKFNDNYDILKYYIIFDEYSICRKEYLYMFKFDKEASFDEDLFKLILINHDDTYSIIYSKSYYTEECYHTIIIG